ncbi:urease accessory protein UreD [Helicobacter ailurogastricus]|uniref:Urease accessory protein UreD n=1 Tax=Helicobacter ailurogastricus TaxID=1578720 RepID=A0A0K2X3X4_9HELI|nr:urease accessory protein UreD [Helicobacter ailurogastricus]CRF40571.1 Urease accessory protein UreD [Helicobacter ailurogastricus]CRF42693.1 Urease accessory protein UreD [Helicobacter ailurogastricus]CRF43814.1 Urease accessory protein UreD [Helicobacter ailurogastricus]
MEHKSSYAQASRLKLKTKIGHNGKCVIADNYFTPPFKLMPPFYERDSLAEIMLIAVSPGMLKGDAHEIEIEVGQDCQLKLSSQSFEKVQDTEDGYASRKTHIEVKENALLDFSPLPIIPFANAHFQNHSQIVLHENAQLLYSEIITAGRIAHGEAFAFKRLHSTLNIAYSQENSAHPLFVDNTLLEPATLDLKNPCMFGNYTHYLNLVAFTKHLDQDSLLGFLKGFEGQAGVSTLASKLPEGYTGLCLKALACGSEPLLNLRKSISQELLGRLE